jgi:predicted Zn-dependent peptidase
MTAKLILLDDIYEIRKRKEDELEFYHKELKKLMIKLDLVRHEITVTNQIIELIKIEKVVDVQERIRTKSAN